MEETMTERDGKKREKDEAEAIRKIKQQEFIKKRRRCGKRESYMIKLSWAKSIYLNMEIL